MGLYTLRLHLFLQKCIFHHQRSRKMYFVIQFAFSEIDRFLLFRFDFIWRFQNENGLQGNLLGCHRSSHIPNGKMIVSTTQEMNKLSVCEPQSSGDHMHPKVHHALKIHGQKSNKNLWLNGVLRISFVKMFLK